MCNISVTGLGYVGLPLATAFGEINRVIGFDLDEKRISYLKFKIGDCDKYPSKPDIFFTSDAENLRKADFHIIAVPTPINSEKKPNLILVEEATITIGSIIKEGDVVVYESTFYPGLTEDICIPLLERFSGLKSGKDFKVGYSPERVSPSTAFTLKRTSKLVAGQDSEALDIIQKEYKRILGDLVVPVSSIKVAEASKILENVQRDVNIGLINQISLYFKSIGVDTQEVLNAAKTKWNFGYFYPGLVGGHCIGVDSYYLTHASDNLNVDLSIVKEARKANENMVIYIFEQCKQFLENKSRSIEGSVVTIIGLTFKENCADIRNSKSLELKEKLEEEGAIVYASDPFLGLDDALVKSDIVIYTVAHDLVKKNKNLYNYLLVKEDSLVLDLIDIFKEEDFKEGISLWKF